MLSMRTTASAMKKSAGSVCVCSQLSAPTALCICFDDARAQNAHEAWAEKEHKEEEGARGGRHRWPLAAGGTADGAWAIAIAHLAA